MKIDITTEIKFQTARSGGKGGQNVNKVETMVEGRWDPAASVLISRVQAESIRHKLTSRITLEGYLLVKSQSERSQLGNKEEVIRKMNELVNLALVPKKLRIATRPGPAAKQKRIETKKQQSFVKANRRQIKPGDY